MRLVGMILAALALSAAPSFGATYARGVDVSHWNGSIDWLQVADDGNTFVFAKATESTTFTDATYPINRAGAQGVGLRLGAYHLARPSGASDAAVVASAVAQADYFVGAAQVKAGDLPPVLDLEKNGGLTAARLTQWTTAWLDEVYARTGVRALVYSSPNFWKTSLADTVTLAQLGHKLWIAHWTKNAAPLLPAANWNGLGWSFWQWTDCVRVPGFAHCSDGDRANGPSPIPFALPAYAAGAPVPSTPPTVVGTAKAGTLLAAVPGTWSGGKPVSFAYQWQSCDAAGAGCVPIAGATLATYTPSAVDIGHALVLAVTASTARGTAVASAPPTAAVAPAGSGAAARPTVISAPAVTGTTQTGQVLTGSAGAWTGSPTTFAYAWRRCDATGAACVPIPGATASTYTPTPGDIGSTLSLVVTATGRGGAQSATASTTGVVAAAPLPAAAAGSLVAQAGAAGVVVSPDARATVTWQPGAVPAGATVSLSPFEGVPLIAGTGVTLGVAPGQPSLPWPVDLVYAAAPADAVVGFSTNGKVWTAVDPVTTPALTGGLLAGAYSTGGVLHVVTRQAGTFALFRPGRWGDPRRVSSLAPVVRRVMPLKVVRQRDGAVLVTGRLSTSSQAHVYVTPQTKGTVIRLQGSHIARAGARQALLLNSGGFPVRWRITTHASVVRLRVRAVDPWGRSGGYTLSFRVP